MRAVRDGENVDEVAKKFSIHPRTVRLYLIKDNIGTLSKVRKSTGRPSRFDEKHLDILIKRMESHSDATLLEHSDYIFEMTGERFSEATIHRKLKAHGYTLKKTYIAAERDEVKRADFLNDIASIMHCPENWVFIDESFFQENMVRRYARSL